MTYMAIILRKLICQTIFSLTTSVNILPVASYPGRSKKLIHTARPYIQVAIRFLLELHSSTFQRKKHYYILVFDAGA